MNRYEPGARLTLHQDKDERDFGAPIVSVSLGVPATFLFGGLARKERLTRVPLEHGDVVVWGGPARLRYHGVAALREAQHAFAGARANQPHATARRMSDARDAVRELAAALRKLHHELLLATRKSFEKLNGRVDGPGALLQLAVHDPLFAWLRPLSQELALLDELASSDEVGSRDFARAAAEVAALVDAGSEFRRGLSRAICNPIPRS